MPRLAHSKRVYVLSFRHLKEIDKITDLVCILSREREMAWFIHGVQVGIRLAQEAKIMLIDAAVP